MQITIFSFFSALGWSSLLIIGIYFLRRSRFGRLFGVLPMVLLYLFCAVRMFLPLEFPYTMVASDTVVYPRVYRLLTDGRAALGGQPPVLVLEILWAVGTVGLLVRYGWQYRSAVRSLTQYAVPWDARTERIFEQVRQQTGRNLRIEGCTAPHLRSAFGMGVLRKRILLPERVYTEEELRYILLHEYTHFCNRDTLIKLMTVLLCAIFWWNPVVYLLHRDLEQTLELKCDRAVARTLNTTERADYLRVIIAMLRQSEDADRLPCTAAAFSRWGGEAAIKERFAAVMACAEQPRRAATAVLIGLVGALLVLSYAVLPQPAFKPPEIENEVCYDNTKAYIGVDADGKYWMCLQGWDPIPINDTEAKQYLHMRGYELRTLP